MIRLLIKISVFWLCLGISIGYSTEVPPQQGNGLLENGVCYSPRAHYELFAQPKTNYDENCVDPIAGYYVRSFYMETEYNYLQKLNSYYCNTGNPHWEWQENSKNWDCPAAVCTDSNYPYPIYDANQVVVACSDINPEPEPLKNAKGCGVGNPINPASGNKYQKEMDYQDPQNRLSFYRIYQSRDAVSHGSGLWPNRVGKGWKHNYQMQVAHQTGTVEQAHIIRPNGMVYIYEKQQDNSWKSDADITARLSAIIENEQHVGWTFSKDGRKVESYDNQGRLTQIDDGHGHQLSFQYQADGLLERVSDEQNRALTLSYDSNQKLTQLTLPSGKSVAYLYDTLFRLIEAQYPTDVQDQTNRRIYHYESASFLNGLTGITDEKGERYATFGCEPQ